MVAREQAEGLDTGAPSYPLGDLDPFSDPSKAPDSGWDSCSPAARKLWSSAHLCPSRRRFPLPRRPPWSSRGGRLVSHVRISA